MNEKEHFLCSNCGATVSRGDAFCKSCGRALTRPSGFAPKEQQGSAKSASEETHENENYSVFQRFYKLLVSPSKAMKDIGVSPEYGGPVVLVILQIILASASVALAYQKIQWTGDPGTISQAQGYLSTVLTIAVLLTLFLFIVFWLVKSLLVKYLCDSGSAWSFGTAASVTGYAYLPDVIFAVIGMPVVYWLLPSVTFNVSDLAASQQAIASFQAQTLWIQLAITVPLTFIALLWKSYLGGLGTKFGTDQKCSVQTGFAVFFVLALLGWLISFLVRGTI